MESNSKLSQSKPSLLSSQLSLTLRNAKSFIPDGGWGWVVVFATFIIYAIAEGVSFVFGLLYVEFLYEFQASKSATSWVGSLFMALPLIAGPICSALVDKYGCRKMTILGSLICTTGFVLSSYVKSIQVLYVTFGVIGGIGRGLVYITVVVSVAFWFEKRRSIALGISASGTGVGTVIFAPVTAFLISEFGWRGTVLILAGFFANMSVCGVLMIDPAWVKEGEKQEKNKKLLQVKARLDAKELKHLLNHENDAKISAQNTNISEMNGSNFSPKIRNRWYDGILDFIKTLSSFSLFLELHFLLLAMTCFFAGTWFLVPYFYLADHMTTNGYTEADASFALSAIGFANTIGMVLLGWLGDRLNVAKTFAVSLALCGTSIWGIIFFTNNYILLVGCSASFGLFFASCFSLSPSLLAQLVPLDDFTMGYGLMLLCEGTGHLIGPPLAGLITDLTKSWAHSFYQAGLWVFISGILIGIIPFTKNRVLLGSRNLKNVEEEPSLV